jgi:hypothetical protein
MTYRDALLPGALGLAVLVFAGCGNGDEGKPKEKEETKKEADSSPNEPAATVDPATAGTISGRITFEGTPPAEKSISVEADPFCASKHPDGLKTESAVVSKSGELANVFVWIKKGISGKWPVPSTPVVLDQNGCHYVPHVFGMQTGQEILIRNSVGTMHNVHALAKANSEFNFAQTSAGSESKQKMRSQEVMVKFKCDVHGWMSAYCGVVKHPYFAVTGADGTFELKNVPPGEYEVEAWHEKFGTKTATLKVEAKGAAKADFVFKGE